MFHVSTPTLVYKHWLNGALNWLFKNSFPNAKDYKNYLEEMAKAFLFDHYLAQENPLDYYEIIFKNLGKCINKKQNQINLNLLNKGEEVENYIFNYLDYILWKDYNNNRNYFPKNLEDKRITNFEYTFRSSVEHYYPQNPIEGKQSEIPQKWLHNFGNLCLISSSKNSKLNNYMPFSKKEHYKKSSTLDSIKQCIMMSYEQWDIDDENHFNAIKDHYEKMEQCILEQLNI